VAREEESYRFVVQRHNLDEAIVAGDEVCISAQAGTQAPTASWMPA
jgi:hypothetical protein